MFRTEVVRISAPLFQHWLQKSGLLSKIVPRCSLATAAQPANKEDAGSEKVQVKRKGSSFRSMVTADGSSGFRAELDRYHLYCSLACPFANRTLIMRNLKGLQDCVTITVVDWLKTNKGWNFTDEKPKCSLDPINGKKYMKDIYLMVDPSYSAKISLPVLFDKKENLIVNNESGEIVRMFNKEFNEFCQTEEQRKADYYPDHLKAKIDEANAWIFPKINFAVYTAGLAKTQKDYDSAVKKVFDGLDKLESVLSQQRYVCGSELTEADVKLFPSLMRFDTVYYCHFKCNKKRIVDYPNIWSYTRELYSKPEFRETIDQEHIQKFYMMSQTEINPFGIVAIGPDIDFDAPHDRDKLFPS